MITKIISGNFNVEIDGSVNPDKQSDIDSAGITNIAQRDGLSAVYGELLEKGEKRNTLAYSDNVAEQFAAELEKALAPYVNGVSVLVTEHVPGETVSSRSQATAMWAQIQASPSKFVPAMLGLTDFNVTDEVGIEACHTFLAGFRKPVERKAKAA